MKQTLAGVPDMRFAERDYYLAIACEMCGVTPLEVMSREKRSMKITRARSAVMWMLYNNGGLTGETVGSMMGMHHGSTFEAVNRVNAALDDPRRDPLLAQVVNTLLQAS